MSKENPKAAFDEAITHMTASASPYFRDYVFYMHLISQCRLVFDETLPAAAGVSFHHDRYTLHLNPKPIIAEGTDPKTKKHVQVLGFCKDMPLEQRIGILKHEMLHIILQYFSRIDERDPKLFNMASDCALNQEINRQHLPDYAIYPDNLLPNPTKKVALRETSEYYYELLQEEKEKQKGKGKGQGGQGEGQGSGDEFEPMLDDHSIWETSEGDSTLQQEFTKNMVEKAANSAQKARGNLPSNYGQIIENLTVKREVNWKQLLRRIVGNKKANVRKTLLRKDRRMPHAGWLKGKTKDRVFDLLVIGDESGSVSNEELGNCIKEIVGISKLMDTPTKYIAIDTVAHDPVEIKSTTTRFERKACGGTNLHPALDKANECNIRYDAVVVITDNYLADTDIDVFLQQRKPIIWLITSGGANAKPQQCEGLSRAVKLKNL